MKNKPEHSAIFELIETWEPNNIALAIQLIKKNEALKKAVEARYKGLFKLLGRKTIKSLENVVDKINANPALFRKQWFPDKKDEQILANIGIKELNLSGMQLKIFPEWVCYLRQLETLRIDHNKLDKLPESFCRLTQLQSLYINHNKLVKLPLLIGRLKKMQLFQAKNNQIATLPNSIGQLKQLEQLDLQRNKINKLPDSIGRLKQLKKLDLSKNKLSSISHEIGKLNHLQQLFVHNNPPLRIPRALGLLKNLQTWYVDRKSLQNIPAELMQLQLEELCIVSRSLDFPMNIIKGSNNIRIHFHFLLYGNSKNLNMGGV